MAVDPQAWQTAYGVTVTIDGKAYKHKTGRFRYQRDRFDTTHNQASGWKSHGLGARGVTLSGTIPLDLSATNKVPAIDSYVSFSFSDGNQTYSGNGYVASISSQFGGTGGYDVEYELESTGTVTIA